MLFIFCHGHTMIAFGCVGQKENGWLELSLAVIPNHLSVIHNIMIQHIVDSSCLRVTKRNCAPKKRFPLRCDHFKEGKDRNGDDNTSNLYPERRHFSQPFLYLSQINNSRCHPAYPRTGRREDTSPPVTDVSESTVSILEVAVMPEDSTTTVSSWISTIPVTLVRSVCVPSTT